MYEAIKEWIVGLGLWGAIVLSMITILPALLWLLKPLILNNPVARDYIGEYPKKRQQKRNFFSFFGGGFAKWKSGVYGPRDRAFEVPPYCSSHVISFSNDKCTVRSDHRFFTRRIVLGGYVFGIIFMLGFMIFMKDYLKYGESRQYCITNEIEPETGYRKSVYTGGGISGYIHARWCTIKLRYNNDGPALEKLNSIFLSSRHFPFTLMLFGLLGWACLFFKKAPPPIIFDRKKRIVYTQYKGKVYVSDWDTLSISPTTGHLSNGLGLELFTKDKQGNWQPKWFSLAGYHYHFEFWIGYLWDSGLAWMKRWEGMRSWLILYMDKGPEYVHTPVDRKGLLDYFVPFRKTLPEDMEQQALSLIGDDKAPGDEDFRIKEKDYPPHIKDLYKYWSDWKTYLNQTLPKKRREVAKGVKNG